MTTDNQKAHLGVAALYSLADQKYWPSTHWSRHRDFVQDPLYLAAVVVYTHDQVLVKVNHEYLPDPLLND